jgi:hypothetical protein
MTGRVTNSISFRSGDPHGACNGLFRIELEGLDTVELRPHQAFIIPKTVAAPPRRAATQRRLDDRTRRCCRHR